MPAQPAPTTTTSCTASTASGRYLIAWPPLATNERGADVRHGAHRHRAGRARALAGAAPRAKPPALRRRRREARRLVRGEGRRAPRPALDARGTTHRSTARDADRQTEGDGCEEGRDRDARAGGDRAGRAP